MTAPELYGCAKCGGSNYGCTCATLKDCTVPLYAHKGNGMTDDQLDDIRSRINPQYSGMRGTESFERKLLTDEILSNRAAIEELVGALKGGVEMATNAYVYWDADQDAKVGKHLIALSGGLNGYDARTDAIHAAIAKHQQPDHIASAGKEISERHQHGVFD